MIKLVLFDLSDVVFVGEEPLFLEKFSEEHNLDKEKFYNRYFELVKASERDEIDGREIWKRLMDEFGFEIDIEQTVDDMIGNKEAYEGVLEFIEQLRQKYRTAYYTNYCRYYWDKIKVKWDFSRYFDYGLVSYETKTRKPDPEGYKKILRHFGVKPEETVYVDDSERNVNSAASLGIKAIHLPERTQLIESLKGAGVEV